MNKKLINYLLHTIVTNFKGCLRILTENRPTKQSFLFLRQITNVTAKSTNPTNRQTAVVLQAQVNAVIPRAVSTCQAGTDLLVVQVMAWPPRVLHVVTAQLISLFGTTESCQRYAKVWRQGMVAFRRPPTPPTRQGAVPKD